MNTNYSWIPFYIEFSNKLVEFKNNRVALIEIIKQVYDNSEMKMPKLEKDNELIDIDPFTVFGLFNKGITDANRFKLINEIKELFNVNAQVPDSFSGIPVLNNQNATYYKFKGQRGDNDIDSLWDVFIAALKYADEPTEQNEQFFIETYNAAKDLKGNKWKLTMGLYWIRPYSYINLDSRNRWFIHYGDVVSKDIIESFEKTNTLPNGEEYLNICNKITEEIKSGKCPYKSFPELSNAAWGTTSELKKENGSWEAGIVSEKNVLGDADVGKTRYWIYAAGHGSSKWDEYYDKGIMAIGWHEIGDLKDYPTKESMKDAMRKTIDSSLSFMNAGHATWQFANEMNPGDVVFVKRGYHEFVGRGIVKSDYRYVPGSEDPNVRDVEWTHKGSWTVKDQIVQKTLTEITPYTDYVADLNALFETDIDNDKEENEINYAAYNSDDFLEEVFMTRKEYNTLVDLVRNKKNVILQGAPGVGKTFAAKRLAYSMMGEKDSERVMMVQFHQSYSYEDFVMGFRPSENGFKLKRGAFYNFCKKAEIDNENEYFFIIDEINRGNLSKIFGELFMLVESDKRGIELQLLYSDENFSVPKNVYIIGMMNIADRSLAMLDYALRRRFAFFEMRPGFETDGFRKYRAELNSDSFDKLISCVENLNSAIASDESLGEGFCIGHSYFCNLIEVDENVLSEIIEYELIPLLKEYWFDEPTKVKDWSYNLRSSIK